MTDTAAIFECDRYVMLPSVLKEPELGRFHRYACQTAQKGGMRWGDAQVPGTPCAGGDFIMDGLLTSLLSEIERASGLGLFPTYSYFRVYKPGDMLARHTDWPSCEISVTLCLGFEGRQSWPIWIEGPRGTSSFNLEPGDALLYRGTECEHWREVFEGQRQAQVFLHYVDQTGPHAHLKSDSASVDQWFRPLAKT